MTEIKFEKLDTIRIPTNDPEQVIEVELSYRKGGMNVFTYDMEKRGYYISAVPMRIIDRGGYKMYAFTAFSGGKICIRECSRKSAKAEREAIALVNGEYRDLVSRLVSQIAHKNNLEVA